MPLSPYLSFAGNCADAIAYYQRTLGAELLDKIWGYETQVETRVADDTVKRLRKKIQSSQAKITTVWGYGFRLINRMFAGDNDDEQEDD